MKIIINKVFTLLGYNKNIALSFFIHKNNISLHISQTPTKLLSMDTGQQLQHIYAPLCYDVVLVPLSL